MFGGAGYRLLEIAGLVRLGIVLELDCLLGGGFGYSIVSRDWACGGYG